MTEELLNQWKYNINKFKTDPAYTPFLMKFKPEEIEELIGEIERLKKDLAALYQDDTIIRLEAECKQLRLGFRELEKRFKNLPPECLQGGQTGESIS